MLLKNDRLLIEWIRDLIETRERNKGRNIPSAKFTRLSGNGEKIGF